MIQDVFAEIRAVQSWQDRVRRADATARMFTVREAANMTLAARMWPDLAPGALLALGKGGYGPDHPLTQQLGELSTALQLSDHPYGRGFGEPSVTPAMRRGQSEARREANRAMAMTSLPGSVPGWLVDASPEDKQAWRQAESAGVTSNGMMVDKGYNVNAPDFYVYRDVLNRLTAAGHKVPIVREEGDRGLFIATGDDKPNTIGLRVNLERLTARPGTEEYRQLVGDVGASGPGFIESAGRLMGAEPASTPQEMDIAGVSELSLTTPVRGAFMAADVGVQELQGQVRNMYAAQHGRLTDPAMLIEPQSDLGVMLTSEFDDAGSGFFVDQESEVAQERRRREAERGQIGGHNVTLGRWVVDGLTPFDPDTKPAMILSGIVDAGVQFADPTAFAAGRLGRVQESRRLFARPQAAEEAAGVVHGLRMMLREQSPQHFLDSKEGIRRLEAFATEPSPYTIWRNSNRKMPLRVANDLADTRTADEARAVLEPQLGGSVREVAAVTSTRGGPIRVMPARGKIDAHDQDIVAWEVEATLRNAHAPDTAIREAVDRVARAKNPIELNAAVRRAIDDDLDGILTRAGVNDQVRSAATRLHMNAHEEASNTFVESITHNGPTDNPLLVAGETLSYPGAHLFVEHAPRYLQLPDARAIRALTSKYPNVFGRALPNVLGRNPMVRIKSGPTGDLTVRPRLPVSVLDVIVNSGWKPLQLMRMAWTVRVVAEEQIRMAASGYDSMFRHPASYIAWRVGHKGGIDVKGTFLNVAEEFKAAMAQAHGGWVDRAMPRTGVKTTFYKENIHERGRFNDAHGSELIRLSSDPVANKVANAESLDEAYDWFTRGPGNKFRGGLASANPKHFATEDAARAYIDTVQRRIDNATGGNADLLAAVRTGKFNGEDMLSGTGQHADLASWLDGYHDDFAPLSIIGTENLSSGAESGWNSFVDRMFGFLMTRRTNNLSRSPTFHQEYWREAERLIGQSSPEAKEGILARAREAKIDAWTPPEIKMGPLTVGRRAISRMERTAANGPLTLDEVDLLAKGRALDHTKKLLYDMTRHGRGMDAARLVFPFGEAWNEVIQTWFHPRTGLASPLTGRGLRNIRRFQQIMQGQRGEDFGEVMGAPEDLEGNQLGFFSVNEFGEEVFTYPGTSLLTDKLLGVPIPLTGRVQGLSMFGTVVPGLGPVAQLPTAWFLQNKPGPQWFKEALGDIEGVEVGPLGTVREQLVPFGAPGETDQAELVSVLSYVPPWMKAAFDWATNGAGNEATWANSVMSMAAYLRSTGRYGNSRADQQQLFEDAEHKARWFFFIKAVGAATLPASPAADWMVISKDDKLVRLRAVAEKYRELQEDDYASADQVFLERYGEDVLRAVQPRSAGVEYAVPVTREGAQWVLENPGVKGDLPHTYGFFAPQGGEFDYSLYSAQFENNERVLLDPETWGRLGNATMAHLELDDARNQVGDDINTDAGRAYMADVKRWLRDEYPGWDDSSGLPKRPSTATMIRELQDALSNDAVRNTDAGRGLAIYMEGRDEVIAAEGEGAVKADGALSEAQRMAGARAYLNDLASWIIDRHPDFKLVFDIVLSREVEIDGA